MKYTVVWHPRATDELTRLWVAASDRGSMTAAANSIDRILQRDPVLRGETHTVSTRGLLVRPVVAIYRVVDEDRIVKILSIQLAPPDPGIPD